MNAITCIIFITFIIFINPVYAADSTPSADIKAKLEELKKEIASKAAKLKDEVSQKLQNKAYVGLIKVKSQTGVTLATPKGPKIVSINQDTEFVSKLKAKKSFSPKTLTLEDFVAALGDIDEAGVLTAKKIVLLPPPVPPKTALWGQIISVSVSEKLATLKNKDLKNIALSLPPSNLRPNDFVILTGNFNKNQIFEAEFVYVIPQGGILKPKKVVYPERSRGATPEASKSKTP